jgi:hypothetical protein
MSRKPRAYTVPPVAEQNEVVFPDPALATREELAVLREAAYCPDARDDFTWAGHSSPGGGGYGPEFGEHRAKIIARGIARERSARMRPGKYVKH